MASVTVFTPNFRRQQVKISPNMTLLEILEEVCKKQEFDANLYDLKHFRTIVDLSQMFRFSGLPTNCELEMVLAKTPRSDSGEVAIVMQLDDGTRCQGNYPCQTTLSAILTDLCPEKADLETNPVIIYTRKEVYGEQLALTTLKNLGLTAGKAMLRLVHKKPEELKVQANVSSMLKITKPAVTKDDKPKPEEKSGQSFKKTNNILKYLKPEEKVEKETKMDVDDVVPGPSSAPEIVPEPSIEEIPKAELKKERKITKEDIEKLESQTISLDDKNTVLFSLNSVIREEEELPDDFFNVNANDLKLMMRHLKDSTKNMDNAPLLTSKLRDLEDSKKTLRQLQFKNSVIRIQFPDRIVLQSVFKPTDSVQLVMDFVKTFLKTPEMKFYLFITPPKTIIKPESCLADIHCVPQALLHFGSEDEETGSFIKDEFMEKLSTASAADFVAAKIRGRIILLDQGEMEFENDKTEEIDSNEPKKQRIIGTFETSSVSNDQKLPKWFKAPK